MTFLKFFKKLFKKKDKRCLLVRKDKRRLLVRWYGASDSDERLLENGDLLNLTLKQDIPIEDGSPSVTMHSLITIDYTKSRDEIILICVGRWETTPNKG